MRNSRRAGKPAGKKPEKQGLLGLFTKGKDIPTTAQQTLPYREMYRDGVCRVEDRYYTKTIEYEDINYQLAQTEDQAAIFDGWSACLNYFDSSLPFQISFLNHRSRPGSRYSVNIPMQDDDYNSVRCEYVEMLENQIAKSNNGIVRTKLLTFGVNVDDLSTARARLERVDADICGNFKKLGVKCRSLSGLERLELLHGQLHPGSGSPFRFSWDMIPKTGLSTKDFIAPDSFDFRFSRLFRVGTTWGAASYLQILASELSDKLLVELLEMDAEMTITLHIQTVDQAAAVKSIKAKVSDIDKMKVEEQKKAARSGYDMDILPPDLVTYSNDAKTLLEDLQSRNERMFLLTFLVVNMAPTRRELDNDLFTVSGIVQKYNCTLKRLDFQQEDGFLSSLPLGHNGIEIKRGMTTSSTTIFVPFMTQELRMDGEAVYYGINALSHNVIMANRKKLKNPNGLFLGVPGSGKSFAAKRELVNVFLATKDRIIVVDPMGEYSPLIRRLGGQVIEIAPDSPHHINPMDIDLSFDEENPMALKADFILSLMELIVGGKDGLQPVERTVIDRCVRQMYREHLQDPETSKMPTLQTLYDLLCSQPEGEAVRLATALEIYVSGSLNVFNHETNVDLNRRLVCLDLKKLGAGLRTIAMLIMQDLVNSQVSMNFLRGIATWCYFDEFHVLLRDRLTASYCVAIWKMLRKKRCVPSALTQNVKDFLASPEIENIFENSDFLVLLSQAQGDRQILAKQLGISPHQLSYVTHTNSGEGLLFFGNTTIPFVDRFPQDTGKAQEPEGFAEKAGSKKDKYQKAQAKAEHAGEKLGKAREKLDKVEAKRAAQFVTRHPVAVLVLLLLLLLCFLVSAVSSIFPTLGSGLANALSGTSYASEDTDLLGVDEDYTALENELAQTVANIESTHPGYDEYRYSVDEIGHNPYELASYLSAKYHVYFREQVQDELREIFEAQYELTLTEEVEIRYRTEISTDPETGETTTEEVPYEYYILNVTLTNKTLPAVILPRLDEQQRQIYTVMQQLKGNKPYLWEGIYNGGEDTGPSYEIPGEALNDPAFAALMEEATKYIGWPYVWGGSSPSTSFDCSGFVCWVYTASGVHNLPRTTAQGIYNQCAIISPSEAKPGDIIFFAGTYDSPGPVSHVGIYVGDGMMLHCGSPIQYANINSSYWQTHFYAFGRL